MIVTAGADRIGRYLMLSPILIVQPSGLRLRSGRSGAEVQWLRRVKQYDILLHLSPDHVSLCRMSDGEDVWFKSPMIGRLLPVHWKGWASVVALAAALMVGATLDDVLRHYGSSILYGAVMIPVGALTLALAWLMAGKIAR